VAVAAVGAGWVVAVAVAVAVAGGSAIATVVAGGSAVAGISGAWVSVRNNHLERRRERGGVREREREGRGV